MSDAASVDAGPATLRPARRRAILPPLADSLATRLLRSVFAWYFVVTLIVTFVQLVIDYRNAEARLSRDIAAMERTFTPGITDAVWSLSDDVLRGILSGMREMPAVVGLKVVDEHGKVIQAVGTVRDGDTIVRLTDPNGGSPALTDSNSLFGKLLSTDFPIVHVGPQGDARRIGDWTVYTDRRIIVQQVADDFYIVLINSVVKTLALWVILFVVIGRTIGRPLRQLSEFVARLNIDNLGDEPFVLQDRGQNELHALAGALNLMTSSLRRSIEENSRLAHDLSDITTNFTAKVAERTKDLEERAATDLLTGLSNRRRLDAAIAEAISASERSGAALSVIICDIDHFKSVNDTYGHQVGDLVLTAASALLRQGVRGYDTVGRWGGEEFMIVCPGAPLGPAFRLAERLRKRIADAVFETVGSKTCSFGVAELRHGEDPKSLVARADAALYRAKQGGRNRVVADGEVGEMVA
jgi:diguanylate cyclase (GGDEF)-like protein